MLNSTAPAMLQALLEASDCCFPCAPGAARWAASASAVIHAPQAAPIPMPADSLPRSNVWYISNVWYVACLYSTPPGASAPQ